MELKEFIERSIRDIFEAIDELQKESDGCKLKGAVCPSEVNMDNSCYFDGEKRVITPVHFDLAVSVGKERGGGTTISIIPNALNASFGLGLGRSKTTKQNLSFDINVILPSIKTEERNIQAVSAL